MPGAFLSPKECHFVFLHAALGQGMVNNRRQKDGLTLGARFGGTLEQGLFWSFCGDLCPEVACSVHTVARSVRIPPMQTRRPTYPCLP